MLLVGEQPGDREDLAGAPFVGPAGKLLDRALEQAGVARGDAYVTNAVKHFRYKQRGKRRIHQRPEAEHIRACQPWLEAELAVVTTGGARLPRRGRGAGAAGERRARDQRSRPRARLAAGAARDGHRPPSSILRSRTDAERTEAYEAFVSDLRGVAEALAS